MDDLGGRLKRYRAAVVILAAALAASILLSAFFALGGWRAARGGVCLVTVRENGAVMDADRFRIVGPLDAKAGGSGYSFRIDYGEVRGKILTADNYEIEFGFINTNNRHNVQISVNINAGVKPERVSQVVTYRSDDDAIVVLEAEAEINGGVASVFMDGV